MEPTSNQITELLVRWSAGDNTAREQLVPLVYEQLRRIARQCLAAQRHNHTLQSTALVHEAYLRLVDHTSVRWENRLHFFAVTAQLMRRILVDHARMKAAKKRGGDSVTLLVSEPAAPIKQCELDLIALDDALKKLGELDSRQCRLVELRFFAGLSIEEASRVLQISPATAKRDWTTARAWLWHAMNKEVSAL